VLLLVKGESGVLLVKLAVSKAHGAGASVGGGLDVPSVTRRTMYHLNPDLFSLKKGKGQYANHNNRVV
jgi:hypothetical protein